jgi:hypothetical protein
VVVVVVGKTGSRTAMFFMRGRERGDRVSRGPVVCVHSIHALRAFVEVDAKHFWYGARRMTECSDERHTGAFSIKYPVFRSFVWACRTRYLTGWDPFGQYARVYPTPNLHVKEAVGVVRPGHRGEWPAESPVTATATATTRKHHIHSSDKHPITTTTTTTTQIGLTIVLPNSS